MNIRLMIVWFAVMLVLCASCVKRGDGLSDDDHVVQEDGATDLDANDNSGINGDNLDGMHDPSDDLDQLVSHVTSLNWGGDRQEILHFLEGAIRKMGADDPGKLIQALNKYPDIFTYEGVIEIVAETLAMEDPNTIAQLSRELNSLEVRAKLLRKVVISVCTNDGIAKSSKLIQELAPSGLAGEMAADVVLTIAKEDLGEALRFSSSISFPEGRNEIAGALSSYVRVYSSELNESEFESIIHAVADHPQHLKSVAHNYSYKLSEVGYDIPDIMEMEFPMDAKQTIASQLAVRRFETDQNASNAIRLFNSLNENGRSTVDFSLVVTERLLEDNIDEATKFVESIDSKASLDVAVRRLLTTWMEVDGVEASTWTSSLPTGSTIREFAIRDMVTYLRKMGDEESALAWEKTLQESK